jgi:hypothetical protein
MRTTRLLFDDNEPAENIARRIVRAFDPGEVFEVKGKFFRVSGGRTIGETCRENVVGDKYTKILNVGEPDHTSPPSPIVASSPPTNPTVHVDELHEKHWKKHHSELSMLPGDNAEIKIRPRNPPPKPTSESGEYPVVREGADKVLREVPKREPLQIGQVWQTKDSRRNYSFVVSKFDDEYVYPDKGPKFAIKRLRNYRLVG